MKSVNQIILTHGMNAIFLIEKEQKKNMLILATMSEVWDDTLLYFLKINNDF